jgi:hypothetical protein
MTQISDPRQVQSIDGLEAQLRQLLAAKNKLTELFKLQDRSFALDGHLIGSVGEVICSYLFNLCLLKNSAERFDAETANACDEKKIKVQIKISSNKTFRFKKEHLIEKEAHNFLILLDIYDDNSAAQKLIDIRFVGTFNMLMDLNKRTPFQEDAKGYVAFKVKPFFCEKLSSRSNLDLKIPTWIGYTPS